MSVQCEEGWFINGRGQRLFKLLYTPPPGVPVKGVLARHHGLGDYCVRTHEGNKFFAKEGYAVWAFDVHGHGQSFPKGEDDRFAILDFNHLIADCEQFLTEIVWPWVDQLPQKVPVFLNGASMGGLVALLVVGGGNVRPVDAAIFSATAAGFVKTLLMRIQEPVAGLLNWLMPRAKLVEALDADRLCVGQEIIEAVRVDPLLPHHNVRVCTAVSMLQGVDMVNERLPSITCPVLMLHGANDVTTAPMIAKAALEGMGSKDKTWVLLTEAKHDLENDLWKEEWHSYVVEWMHRQTRKWVKRDGKPPSDCSTLSVINTLTV